MAVYNASKKQQHKADPPTDVRLRGDKKRAARTFIERLNAARVGLVNDFKSWLSQEKGVDVTTVSLSATEEPHTPMADYASEMMKSKVQGAVELMRQGMDVADLSHLGLTESQLSFAFQVASAHIKADRKAQEARVKEEAEHKQDKQPSQRPGARPF